MAGGGELSGVGRRWPTLTTLKESRGRFRIAHAFVAVAALALALLLFSSLSSRSEGIPTSTDSTPSPTSDTYRYFPEEFPLPAGIPGERVLQRKFVVQGQTGFVSYSSYHLGYRLLTINGLTSESVIDRSNMTASPFLEKDVACNWVVPRAEGGNDVLKGTLHAVVDSSQGLPYSPTILYCEFDVNAEARALLQSPEGVAWVHVGNESFVAKPENKQFLDDNVKEEALPHFLTFCSAEIYGAIETQSILEWVAFHQYHIGFDHLYFYDADAFTPELFRALGPFMDAGMLSVDNFVDTHLYKSNMNAQRVAIHDCLHRTRDSAAWVAYGDMDEYLVAERLPPPAVMFREFLKEQGRGNAEVSRGSVFFELSCTGAGEQKGPEGPQTMPVWGTGRKEFVAEVLLYRQKLAHCVNPQGDNSMCDGWMGHRKGIVNPRMVYLEGGHQLQAPYAYPWLHDKLGMKRHVFSANDVYNAHYRGVTVKSADCGKPPPEEALKNGEIVKTDVVAKIAAKARECAAEQFRDEAKCLPWKTKT